MNLFVVTLLVSLANVSLSEYIPMVNKYGPALSFEAFYKKSHPFFYRPTFLKSFNIMSIDPDKKTWPDGEVPYQIDSDFDGGYDEIIKEAMQEIQENAPCVKFVERTDQEDFIYIRNGPEVSSLIGRKGGKQSLILSTTDSMEKGIIMHELMHVLGFIHEHCRSDRDDFVKIEESNIREDKKKDFIKVENSDNLGESYDYDSIMHYGEYTYAIDPDVKVITPLDEDAHIGQRQYLSEKDVNKLKRLYNCFE